MTKLPQWTRRVYAFGRGETYLMLLPRLGFKLTTKKFVLLWNWHTGWKFRWVK